MVDRHRYLLANVTINVTRLGLLFMGVGLRKLDYEMLMKLGDVGFYKKLEPWKGERSFYKWGSEPSLDFALMVSEDLPNSL